jgi:hypothetical protein
MKENNLKQLPKARTEQLIIKEADNEVLVYDLKTNKAHCLNNTAATIWKNCDGENSVADISASLSKDVGASVDERIVWLGLNQLEQFKLLSKTAPKPAALAGLNRRQVIRALGVAAIALPAVVSIVSPRAVAAASCGQVCNNPTECPAVCPNCAKLNPGSANKTCL